MDVVVGNVILTAVLVVALLLFVASASALAQLYTLRVEQTLLSREAIYVAQSIEELYLAVNDTKGQLPQSVALSLPMPESLGGQAYTVRVEAQSLGAHQTNLTVIVGLAAARLAESSSVVIGSCTVESANPLTFYPKLTVEVDFAVNGLVEECTMLIT